MFIYLFIFLLTYYLCIFILPLIRLLIFLKWLRWLCFSWPIPFVYHKAAPFVSLFSLFFPGFLFYSKAKYGPAEFYDQGLPFRTLFENFLGDTFFSCYSIEEMNQLFRTKKGGNISIDDRTIDDRTIPTAIEEIEKVESDSIAMCSLPGLLG